MYQGADIRGRLEAVTQRELAGRITQQLDKRIVDVLVQNQS